MPTSARVIEYYTYDDYKEWEGNWELIDGVPLAMSPAPMRIHQSLATEIIYNLREQLEDCIECEVLGEIDYKVSDDTILKPENYGKPHNHPPAPAKSVISLHSSSQIPLSSLN